MPSASSCWAWRPARPLSPCLVDKAKGDLGFTAAFMLLASVGTVVCMPFTVPLLTTGLTASAWAIAKPLLIVVLLPMAIGVIIRRQADAFASKLLPFVKKLAGILPAFSGASCASSSTARACSAWRASSPSLRNFCSSGVIFLAPTGLALACRYEQKIVLSIGVTTRNLGACLTPLLSVPDMDQRATLMIVLALPIMVIVSLLGAKWLGPAAERGPDPAPTRQVLDEPPALLRGTSRSWNGGPIHRQVLVDGGFTA